MLSFLVFSLGAFHILCSQSPQNRVSKQTLERGMDPSMALPVELLSLALSLVEERRERRKRRRRLLISRTVRTTQKRERKEEEGAVSTSLPASIFFPAPSLYSLLRLLQAKGSSLVLLCCKQINIPAVWSIKTPRVHQHQHGLLL